MSIQSNINQMLSLVGFISSQSPISKKKKRTTENNSETENTAENNSELNVTGGMIKEHLKTRLRGARQRAESNAIVAREEENRRNEISNMILKPFDPDIDKTRIPIF